VTLLWATAAVGAFEFSLENDRNAVFVFVIVSSAEVEAAGFDVSGLPTREPNSRDPDGHERDSASGIRQEGSNLGSDREQAENAAAAVRSLLNEYRERLQYIPPFGAKPVELPEDGGAIVGYFDELARTEHLPAVRTISSDPPAVITVGNRHLLRDQVGEPQTVATWAVPRHEAPVRIDNQYVEWIDKPDVFVFSEHRRPRVFSREGEEPALRIDIEDSLLWKQGGTQLERLKALMSGETLYLMGLVTRQISPQLSVRLYLYEDRAAGTRNRALIEIPMELPAGPVLLWIEGRSEPVIVGDYARGSYLFETRIQRHRIPKELQPDQLSPDVHRDQREELAAYGRGHPALDVATGLRDAKLYEEFRHGTLFLEAVPRF